jgi:ribosome-binding protein aMBF1 (putative translation factor)
MRIRIRQPSASPPPAGSGRAIGELAALRCAASELGAAILAARTTAGLSQIALAERLETSQANIVQLEKGRFAPRVNTLEKIARATGHELVISFVPKATGKKAA